jgi:transposase
LAEFGIVVATGVKAIEERLPTLLQTVEDELPFRLKQLLARLLEHARYLRCQSDAIEAEIRQWHDQNEVSRRLGAVPGIGPLTASALVVPREHSSGGKAKLLGISKRGDTYLRGLLIHGARSVILRAGQKPGYADSWFGRLLARRHKNIAACALANHTARVVRALMAHDRCYEPLPRLISC